mgnify:CR=1 FL=1
MVHFRLPNGNYFIFFDFFVWQKWHKICCFYSKLWQIREI